MDVLKICPFCGHLPITEVKVTQMGCGEDHIDFSVVCDKCGIHKTVRLKLRPVAIFFDVDKAMQEVKNAWNTRDGEGE